MYVIHIAEYLVFGNLFLCNSNSAPNVTYFGELGTREKCTRNLGKPFASSSTFEPTNFRIQV
jgi:hypothetical protein